MGGELIADLCFWTGAIALFVYVLVSSNGWELSARLMPQALAVAGLIAAAGFAVFRAMGKIPAIKPPDTEPLARVGAQGLWLLGLIVGVKLIGMLPAVGIFAAAYMLVEGRVTWLRAALIVIPFLAGLLFLFQYTLHIPWPQSLLGDLWPGLRLATGRLL
jgi:hypothetical protein